MTQGQEGKSGRREARIYEILVVPLTTGSGTHRFRVSRARLLTLIAGFFILSVACTLAILMFTPIAVVVPIPNPLLEQRYGKQILDTQRRINTLAEQVLLLRDYNTQLRKALGDTPGKDTTARDIYPPSLFVTEAELQAGNRRDVPVLDMAAAEDEPASAAPREIVPAFEAQREILHDRLPLLSPMMGYVSQGYNPEEGHYGIDIAGKRGTPVSAAADGIVVFSGWTYEDGNMIILAHGGGYLTVYKHNQTLLKNIHGAVRRGEAIALLGTSGQTSQGPHLHFEVWKDGSPQDPDAYLLRPSRLQ